MRSPTLTWWHSPTFRPVSCVQESPENKYLRGGREHDRSILPDHDIVERSSTCAVVGNSGVLQLTDLGRAIDEHDVVIRFNDGPTLHFEHKVGLPRPPTLSLTPTFARAH